MFQNDTRDGQPRRANEKQASSNNSQPFARHFSPAPRATRQLLGPRKTAHVGASSVNASSLALRQATDLLDHICISFGETERKPTSPTCSDIHLLRCGETSSLTAARPL